MTGELMQLLGGLGLMGVGAAAALQWAWPLKRQLDAARAELAEAQNSVALLEQAKPSKGKKRVDLLPLLTTKDERMVQDVLFGKILEYYAREKGQFEVECARDFRLTLVARYHIAQMLWDGPVDADKAAELMAEVRSTVKAIMRLVGAIVSSTEGYGRWERDEKGVGVRWIDPPTDTPVAAMRADVAKLRAGLQELAAELTRAVTADGGAGLARAKLAVAVIADQRADVRAENDLLADAYHDLGREAARDH